MESRFLLAGNGFLQGFAFVDADNDNHFDSGEAPKVGATIELRSADGSTLLGTTSTDSTGYYRFDGRSSGTYRLVELPTAGYANQGTEWSTVLSSASQLLPSTIVVNYVDPDVAPQVGILRKPGLPGASVSFTVTGGPFNGLTQPDNVHQYQISINGMPDIYSFCMDLFHGNPSNYPAKPSTVPAAPALTANLGRIGYLYNTFGTKLLSPTDGAGLQTALWELLYDVSPDLNSGDFKLGPGASNAAAITAANSFLTLSAGQDQRAFFFNVSTSPGHTGDQGMIATEYFNFANKAQAPQGDLRITISPDATNEVGDPHTFTANVQEDLGDGIDSDGDGSVFDPVGNQLVTVALTSLNGALAVPAGSLSGNTDASGNFQITFTSATAGLVVGNAVVTRDVNGVTLTRDTDPSTSTVSGPDGSGPATKRFVDAKIKITPDETNEVGQPHTFTVTVLEDSGDGIDSDGDGSTFDPAAGETVDVTLTDTNGSSAVPSTPLSGTTDANGLFQVTFVSATAGQVIGHAASDVAVGGLSLHRETDGTAGNSDDAVKTYVDAKIRITPDETNEVGAPHTFTVTVLEDLGDGIDSDGDGSTFDPAAGESVDVTLTDTNGSSAVPSTPLSGTTDANGQFQVTFVSATAGQVVGHAASDVAVGGLTLSRETDGLAGNSDDAVKTYVDAKIRITPDETNEVGQPHTFTVLVLEDNGDGIDSDGDGSTFDPAAGETVDVNLTDTNGSSAVPSTPLSGTSDANGQFQVTFVSATAGQVIGHAESDIAVGGLSLHRETDGMAGNSGDAKKTYVDAIIKITPDATNEVGQPHTFTVLVLEDNGDGIDSDGDGSTYDPGAGESVTVTLTNANGANAVPAGPFDVITDAQGLATVTFASATAGTVTGHAESDVAVGGLSLHRETDGTAGNSGDAVKTYVDAKILITPDATNAVGDPHTFTVLVLEDNGDGIDSDGDGSTFDPAAGESVTVTLANANGANAVPSTPLSGTTNAAGQFSVIFTSATAGQVIGNASADVSVGGLTLTRDTDPSTASIGAGPGGTGPAVKTFVDAKIAITPNATNAVGDPHTFTVTVLQDDGLTAAQGGDGVTGFTAATVGNVDVTLTGSNGAVPVLNAAASTSDDNQPNGDNLNGSGQTTAVFTSATAGQVTGHATVTLVVGGVTLTRQTDGIDDNSGDAVKTFVDAKISIGPDATNPVGAPHTFTVTVLQDDGLTAAQGGDGVTGFAPATVGNVDVTLTGSGGAVPVQNNALSTVDDNQPNGDNLDASGQASSVFTSATAGTVTGHATVTLVVGGVTLTRETNGLAGNSVDAVKKFVKPGIDIEKTTNGPTNANPVTPDYDNEDSDNGPGVPILTPGSVVNWTYKVTNTGGVDYAFNEVVIVDDNGTPGTADDLSTTNGKVTFLSVQTGDADNILEPGEVWLYTASGTVLDLSSAGPSSTFDFSGNSALDGPDGNIRTFNSGTLSVKASAFSRDKSSGAWTSAFLGSYSGGLGVTDSSEGSGGSNSHTVDNSGRDNYVLFEFSETVVVDAAFLGYVVGDSDLSVWIGSATDPFNNHQTLSDALLTGLGFTEINNGGSSARTANLNAGEFVGNVLVIAAKKGDADDYFKIETLTVGEHACYENKAVVTVPGATDSDLSHYCNPKGEPGIAVKKLTNGADANTLATAAEIAAGDVVTWTYEVKNTGTTAFMSSEIVIADDAGTPGNSSDDFSTTSGAITFQSVLVGDADNLLEPGETWIYKATGIADDLVSVSSSSTSFDFSGNSALDGTDGNIRTFTSGGVSVKTSAFSRDKSTGAWAAGYLGSYSGGLGVTDSGEGNGSGNAHTVDNSGRDNYVLFEFSETVVVDAAFLGYVVGDSDISVWIGSTANPFNNHLTLSDAVLTGLGFTEVNTGGSSTRTADINAGLVAGNVLVISAKKGDSDDYFKIETLKIKELEQGFYKNMGRVSAGGVSASDVSYYVNPDDCVGISYAFAGNTSTTGTAGNVRTYTQSNVSVNTSAFSRTTSGTWNTAYLGAYSDGLGVTDGSENGSGGTHRVDNSGRFNYVLFEFSTQVEVDRAFLDSVVGDSDITIWIGTANNPFHNHLTLSDALLSSASVIENNSTSSSSSRWADFNAGEVSGNWLVIAAKPDSSGDDQFKIDKLDVCAEAVKFYVVDATATDTFEYSGTGQSTANYNLAGANTNPRGVASTAAGNKVWVIDANKVVYVYDVDGKLLGSWTANGLTTPEDITTNGTDVWIVDDGSNKVFKFTNAAGRTSGNQSAASSFNLNSSNANAKGIVTDGSSLWVVNDNSTDKVFKYNLAGTLQGSWTIDSANDAPTGITIDPADVGNIWIVDGTDDAVYRYNNATGRTSGSQSAANVFQLAGGNVNPQGIADPPPGGSASAGLFEAPIANLEPVRPTARAERGARDFAFADISASTESGKTSRPGAHVGRRSLAAAVVPDASDSFVAIRPTGSARQTLSTDDLLWDGDQQSEAADEYFSEFESAQLDDAFELVGAAIR